MLYNKVYFDSTHFIKVAADTLFSPMLLVSIGYWPVLRILIDRIIKPTDTVWSSDGLITVPDTSILVVLTILVGFKI